MPRERAVRMETAGGIERATSIAAQVKLVGPGNSNQAAMVCLRYRAPATITARRSARRACRFEDDGERNGGAEREFAATVATGTWYNLKLSVDAAGVLSATLGTTVVGTYTPAALDQRQRRRRDDQHDRLVRQRRLLQP